MIIPVEGFAGQRRPVQNLATEIKRVCLGLPVRMPLPTECLSLRLAQTSPTR